MYTTGGRRERRPYPRNRGHDVLSGPHCYDAGATFAAKRGAVSCCGAVRTDARGYDVQVRVAFRPPATPRPARTPGRMHHGIHRHAGHPEFPRLATVETVEPACPYVGP